jgi:ATP-dependent helicase/nuclease subunit A
VQDLAAWRDLVALYRHNALRLRLGLRGLDHYAALKARDRCLDFHDLERLARNLVRDGEIGPWILYRLDARLDHLLVDEFQDTNRNHGRSSRRSRRIQPATPDGRPRSVFVVGDVKQSIYGFRGAQPGIFAEVERWLSARTKQAALTLPVNFRSLPAIVDTVGDLFQAAPLRDLLPNDLEVAAARQAPFRDDGPGRVLLLPPVEDRDGDDGTRHAAAAALAARVIRDYLARGTVREDGRDRPARYGDVLVLSRTRTHLQDYGGVRAAGIPIVPAGRGAPGAQPRGAGRCCCCCAGSSSPTDDATLAGVLRSPLARVGERGRYCWPAAAPGTRLAVGRCATPRRVAVGRGRGVDGAGCGPWVTSQPTGCCVASCAGQAPSRFAMALGGRPHNLLRLHDLALAHEQSAFPRCAPSRRGRDAALRRTRKRRCCRHRAGRVRI